MNLAETLNGVVSVDVSSWKVTFTEFHRVKTTLKVLNIVDAASGMHISIRITDQTAETIWKAFATGWLRWAGAQDVFGLFHIAHKMPEVSLIRQKTRHIC